jgi:hypothetical protein
MHLQVEALIAELIATGAMDETTVADLTRMRSEATEGKLDADDESYIRALHARITNAPLPEPIEAEIARLDGLSIAEWRDRATAAEAELAALRDQLASTPTSA